MLTFMRNIFRNKNNGENIFLWSAWGIFFFLVIKASIHWTNGINDTIEHLQAAWFVGTGKVPYRDFFEHHNSLLWYILAPIVKLFAYNANIIYVAKILAVILYFFCFGLMYHIISKHLANKQIAKLSLIYLMILPIVSGLINIRPDVFMLLCNLLSLNYFYNYLDNKRRRDLIISYVLLSVSFLFLQKSLVFILGFGLGNLYMLYKRRVAWKDCLIAGFVAIIPLVLFAYYLYVTNSFADYYFYNFVFNFQLREYFGNIRWDKNLHIYALLSLLIYVRFLRSDDKNLFFAIIVAAQALSLWYFAPYSHYFVSYFVFSAVGGGYLFQKLGKLFPDISCYVCVFVILLTFYNIYNRKDDGFLQTIENAKYLSNPQLKVLSLNGGCIYCQPVQYHWFFYGVAAVVDDLYNKKGDEPNQLIASQKADVVFIPDSGSFELMYPHNYNVLRRLFWRSIQKYNEGNELNFNLKYWKIDHSLLKENYEEIKIKNGGTMWKRKNTSLPAISKENG